MRNRCVAFFAAIMLLVGMLSGCGSNAGESYRTMDDFQKAKVGVLTGSCFDVLAKEFLPTAEKVYSMNVTDLILSLKQGKIDGILMDRGFYAPLQWEEEGLSFIEMDMPATGYAAAFPKTEEAKALKEQVDEFIREQTASGWLEELETKWTSGVEPDDFLDLANLTGENGTLKIATTVESKPFDYMRNGQNVGLSVEFIIRFAEEYGYAVEFDVIDFGALLPSLCAERYDLAVSSITVTEERKESVLFSEIYYKSPVVMAVPAERNMSEPAEDVMTLEDFSEARIGIITGSAHDGTAKRVLPNAERVYFNTMADLVLAVEQGKIDCYMEDDPFLTALIWEGMNLKRVDEPAARMDNGFVFPQREESYHLKQEINAFIAKIKADGTFELLKEKWLGEAEPTEHPDYNSLTGENGTIRLAVSVDNKPILYKYREDCTGLEMELLTLFAQEHGYAFDIEIVPFESVIAGIAAGKYDMAASALNITPEREESVDFSDPYCAFDVVLVTKEEHTAAEPLSSKTLDDFQNSVLGVLTGSVYEDIAKQYFPAAERQYYTLQSDLVLAVEQRKIDGFISENIYYIAAKWEGAGVAMVEGVIDQTNAGFIFQKDGQSAYLREQLNTFLRDAKENGLIAELQEKWLSPIEPETALDFESLTGENGTIRVATAPDLKPVSYLKNGSPTGYEMELLVRFAKEYGYKLETSMMTFDAILPSVTTGKFDIGSGAVTITEERSQSLDFSDSHMTVDVVILTNAEKSETRGGFWNELREDFEKTFIREDRWKLILEGIGVTVLISVCAAVAGSFLGFGLYMLSRADTVIIRKAANGVAKVYSRIIAGTPVVVILMILFYVIFGKMRDISGVLVAIIGFSLTFGAFVFDHMVVSVNSVDRGQTEAALALGYTKNKTFFRIVFPQAMSIFLPSYCGQAVELVKATAVVGYIAVNDLTKMGDIIRSNTYEAFFPLISTAVIYFLLTWLLSLLLSLVRIHFEPKRRSKEKILEGVKTV